MTPPRSAVVLFAHGSRDPLWHVPIEAVARQARQMAPDMPVLCSYLELTSPDLPEAIAALKDQNIRHIRILPMFLGVGRHAREDLPLLLQGLRQTHPELELELLPAVGEHPAMTTLMAELATGRSLSIKAHDDQV